MKQTDPHFKIRLPPDLKARIEESAKTSQRSMTAEIVARLEDSFRDIRAEARAEYANERMEKLIDILERNEMLERYPDLLERRRKTREAKE